MKALIATAAAVCFAMPAWSQGGNCAPRDEVIQRLAQKYGESRQSIGLGQRGMVMETFASSETGSWTITVTTPQGMTCLIASGQDFEAVQEASADEGDPV